MLGTLPPERKTLWKDSIGSVVHAYNCTRHDSTGYTPFELMFGRSPRLPIDAMYNISPLDSKADSYTKYVQDLRNSLGRAFQLASKESKSTSAKQKEYYDLKVRGAVLHPGDVVLVRKTGLNVWDKLADRWEEPPYTVIKRLSEDIPVYVVQPASGGRKRTLHRNLLLPIRTKKVDVQDGRTVSDVADSANRSNPTADAVSESDGPDDHSDDVVAVIDEPSVDVDVVPDQSVLHQPDVDTSGFGNEAADLTQSDNLNGSIDHSNDVDVDQGSEEVDVSHDVDHVTDQSVPLPQQDLDVSDVSESGQVSDSSANDAVGDVDEGSVGQDQVVGSDSGNLDVAQDVSVSQPTDSAAAASSVSEAASSSETAETSSDHIATNSSTEAARSRSRSSDIGASRRSTRQKHPPKRYGLDGWQMQVIVPQGEPGKPFVASCPVIVMQPKSILEFMDTG